jgi:tellurite resistance protein
MSEQAVITACVTNADLREKIDGEKGVLAYWNSEFARLDAEYDAEIEREITRLMAKKTFWTRRTRTRAEAERMFNQLHDWGFRTDVFFQRRRAEQVIDRLKQILEIAEDDSFQNITLPEGDLRLVGGPPEI